MQSNYITVKPVKTYTDVPKGMLCSSVTVSQLHGQKGVRIEYILKVSFLVLNAIIVGRMVFQTRATQIIVIITSHIYIKNDTRIVHSNSTTFGRVFTVSRS